MVDIISLVAGALAALALAVLIYTQRERIAALRDRAGATVQSTRAQLSRTQEGRYRDAVTQLVNTQHLAGHLIPLERIAVMPRFYTLPLPFNPVAEEQEGADNPLNLLPRLPNWPDLLAPYQIPGLSLRDLMRSGHNVALLGLPGSGRSVALSLIALLLSRQNEPGQQGGLLAEPRLPLVVHAGYLDASPDRWGKSVDVLEPLLAAARALLPGATTALQELRPQLAQGQCVILVDGWDEVPPQRQAQAIAVLKGVISLYPGNQFVVSGPARGYQLLVEELGLAPTFILPWSGTEYNELLAHWTESWPVLGANRRESAGLLDSRSVDALRATLRGLSPFEASLRTWACFAGHPGWREGRGAWCDAYLERLLPEGENRAGFARVARVLAERWDDQGLAIDEVAVMLDTGRSEPGRVGSGLVVPDTIEASVTVTRLLREWADERLSFTHPLLMAYLAARALNELAFQEWAINRASPYHDWIVAYLAEMVDVTPYAEAQFRRANTIGHDELLLMGRWATYAPASAPWRSSVLKRAAQMLLAPDEYPTNREAAASALVASRDRNAALVFRQGLKSPEPFVRILCALALGAVGDAEDVIILAELLNDELPPIVAAATLALGAVGSKTAVNYLIQIMMQGPEMARRAAGEMFATDLAGEGHSILAEAVDEEDPGTRRAALYGLERIDADWVRKKLGDIERLDSMWVNRNAATMALERLNGVSTVTIPVAPAAHETAWLHAWAEAQQLTLDPQYAEDFLLKALQASEEVQRLAAVEALGALGISKPIAAIYPLLRDPHPDIRDSAFRALYLLGTANGQALPGTA